MTNQEPTQKSPSRWWLIGAFVGGLVIMGLIAALLVNITTRKAEGEQYPLKVVEIADDELDRQRVAAIAIAGRSRQAAGAGQIHRGSADGDRIRDRPVAGAEAQLARIG